MKMKLDEMELTVLKTQKINHLLEVDMTEN